MAAAVSRHAHCVPARLGVAGDGLELRPHELVEPGGGLHHAGQARAGLGHVLRALKQAGTAELPARVAPGRLDALPHLRGRQPEPAEPPLCKAGSRFDLRTGQCAGTAICCACSWCTMRACVLGTRRLLQADARLPSCLPPGSERMPACHALRAGRPASLGVQPAGVRADAPACRPHTSCPARPWRRAAARPPRLRAA